MGRATFLQIAREGWAFILLALALSYAVGDSLDSWAAGLPFLALAALLAAFFRDPPRRAPPGPLAVIAPVDGRITHRRECYDPFLDREAIRISIGVAAFGAYSLRSVVDGTVLELPECAAPDYRGTASWVRTDEGEDIVVAVPDGSLFGADPYRQRYGERVGQGRKCGHRRLARVVDIYLPPHARPEVEVGARVRAGADLLATLVRKRNGNEYGESSV